MLRALLTNVGPVWLEALALLTCSHCLGCWEQVSRVAKLENSKVQRTKSVWDSRRGLKATPPWQEGIGYCKYQIHPLFAGF